MNRTPTVPPFTMLLPLILLAGCMDTPVSIVIDGSSTVYPMTEAVAEEYREEAPEVRVIAGVSGTGGGMKKFIAGTIDVCGASRPIRDAEKKACSEAGVQFVQLEVAFDGLAVVLNPANDWCDHLTVDQLKELWRPNSAVNNWSDLNPDWPHEAITLYGPGTDSGTFDSFTESIVGEVGASRADYTASEDDNVLVTGVQEDPYALGYFGFAYYRENQDRLKLLAVDDGQGGITPSEATVRNGTYTPLSRPLYLYVRTDSLLREEVQDFIRFYLDRSAELAREVGYVPISEGSARINSQVLSEVRQPPQETQS